METTDIKSLVNDIFTDLDEIQTKCNGSFGMMRYRMKKYAEKKNKDLEPDFLLVSVWHEDDEDTWRTGMNPFLKTV